MTAKSDGASSPPVVCQDYNGEWADAPFTRPGPTDDVARLPDTEARPTAPDPRRNADKAAMTVAVDRAVLDCFRAAGRNWEQRVEDILRATMEAGEPIDLAHGQGQAFVSDGLEG